MSKQPGVASNSTGTTLTVLSVSPLRQDHLALEAIFGHSKWKLLCGDDRVSALPLLEKHNIAVVLCEADVQRRTWVDLLESFRDVPHPPSLIVASRLADERLWAEALNLGAWDVLCEAV